MIKNVLGISLDRNSNDWGKINNETSIFTWPEEAEDDSQIEADSDDNLFFAGGDQAAFKCIEFEILSIFQ